MTAKAGAEHFAGVTVQKMVRSSGAYELILGSSIDSQFGPVLLFGTGGQLVEVFKDWSLAIPPLNTTLARRMMEQTQIYTALHGVRGRKPVDLARLERLLVRFSQLVMEQPWIKEIDINPLLVSPTTSSRSTPASSSTTATCLRVLCPSRRSGPTHRNTPRRSSLTASRRFVSGRFVPKTSR